MNKSRLVNLPFFHVSNSLPFSQVLCYIVLMTIEQTVEIPADYRVFLELPHSIPSGGKAKVKISIPAAVVENQNDSVFPQSEEIEDVRQLLQKEMAEKGTSQVKTVSGGGWEIHVREHYAEP